MLVSAVAAFSDTPQQSYIEKYSSLAVVADSFERETPSQNFSASPSKLRFPSLG